MCAATTSGVGFGMDVRQHMSTPPIAITGDTDFKTALGLMEKHLIRRLPVVDVDGVIAGIVVERDLLIAADRYLNSPVDVARFMTRQVVTVRAETPVIDAATLMTERKIGGLPVVDASGKLRGIITETDLLHALIALLRRQAARARRRRRNRAVAHAPRRLQPARRTQVSAQLQPSPRAKAKRGREGATQATAVSAQEDETHSQPLKVRRGLAEAPAFIVSVLKSGLS